MRSSMIIRSSLLAAAVGLLTALLGPVSAAAFLKSTPTTARGILTSRASSTTFVVGYRSGTATSSPPSADAGVRTSSSEAAPFAVDQHSLSFYDYSSTTTTNGVHFKQQPAKRNGFKAPAEATQDPSKVEFVALDAEKSSNLDEPTDNEQQALFAAGLSSSSFYPFAAMMQCSAAYIADHAGKIAVLHLPGEVLEGPANKALLQDIALCWLLGLKLVIVTGCRYSQSCRGGDSLCSIDGLEHAHECHNALKVTDREILRNVEEEAGYLRTEIERKLNRCLRMHGSSVHSNDGAAPPEGNVVSGNFYTAQHIGEVRGQNYEYTGYATETHTRNIMQVLDNNDVVVLSTVGLSPMGELVNVNGYHLAATVAASIGASKLIYMANQEDSVILKHKDQDKHIQELPLSFAQAITDYHQVKCRNPGFATFQKAKETLDPAAVELLLHLGWSSWAVDKGVTRAHIVNQGDGALLEELFTPKNGANTCLYHDDELLQWDETAQDDDVLAQDWDAFFDSAAEQGQSVAHFD